MDVTILLLLLAGGALTGFLAGFFGVGGGIILVPILLVYLSATGVSSLVATHVAFGTSLLVIIFTSLSSAYQYRRNGHVVWRAVMIIGVGSVVGAWLGSWVASELRGETLQKVFAGVVVVAAIRLLSEQRKPKGEDSARMNAGGLSLTGLVVGVVSSLAGVGGGVFSVPIMYSILRFPLKKALGTSSATIVITALAAVTGYVARGWGNPSLPPYTFGYVAYLAAIPLALTSIPFARVGASLAHKTKADNLRKFFAAFLLIVAAKMFLFP